MLLMSAGPWVKWPLWVKTFGFIGVVAGLLYLDITREILFSTTMQDVETDYDAKNAPITCGPETLQARTADGTCNIFENPAEGSRYIRFGRNVADISATYAETTADNLLIPNPRDVSNSLMARDGNFKPVTSINFVAGAWIQFMVHDWFDHGPNSTAGAVTFPLPADDINAPGTMTIKRTVPDPSTGPADAGNPATYQNQVTHWWDGSQLYGSDQATQDSVRSFVDGKLTINNDGTLPTSGGIPITGFSDNWWVGLSMLHQLFTKEHNTIAGMLITKYPGKTDQWYFDKARLINSALMAKIHTVEWTPAIIANPVTEMAMKANWWGLIGTQNGLRELSDEAQQGSRKLSQSLGLAEDLLGVMVPDLISDQVGTGFSDYALLGIVGSAESNNYDVPFTLTEEFVSVYRMHALMRNQLDVFDIGSNIVASSIETVDTLGADAEDVLDQEGADRLWYSFGVTTPGSLELFNYPEFLRNLDIPVPLPFSGSGIDLAAIDVFRDRERGIPRYNEFRRQIRLEPITSFEDLSDDPAVLAELKRLYNNDIEMIDTQVGMMAEPVRPEGFGFSETAFQIFIMNASRRLMTDRFYTKDFTAEVYTPEGLEWVDKQTMNDVLIRHNPSLASPLAGVENAFKPWGLEMNTPDDYESWSACDKQDHLWDNGVQPSKFNITNLPALEAVDIGGLISSILWDKVNDRKDIAPAGYKKPLHAHGAMAKVAFVPTAGSSYTGVFEGSQCGLLRLSLTGDPDAEGITSTDVAPGLAWKAFIDGEASENVSALVSLSGQGDDYNVFANELSQYVQKETNQTIVTTAIFSAVSSKPTRLRLDDMAKVRQDGSAVGSVKSPSQVYFVPSSDVSGVFSSSPHDFREDLLSLNAGATVYDVYATNKRIKTSWFPWTNDRYIRERRNSAVKIGELVMLSDFESSAFGDEGIFFKHQRYEDN